MRKVYLIPNGITAFALTCGLFVIFKTSVVATGNDLFSLLQASAILLLIAAVADMADGAIARLFHAQSAFGGQFDSLADAVNFGVAPPLLVLKSLTGTDGGPSRLISFIVILASMIYALCGVLRLVRYNVQSKTAEKAKPTKHFTGLPIPGAAAAVISASLILISPLATTYFPWSSDTRALLLSAVLLIIGYFMVSRWKFPSVQALRFQVPSFYLVFATGVFAVALLWGILDYFPIAYFAASWIYLLIAWTLSLIRLIAGKRSQTLVDFEPDDEE